MTAQFDKKTFYLVLEYYDQHQQAYGDKLVKYRPGKAQFKYLSGHRPHGNESHYTVKNVYGAGLFHLPENIVQQHGND